MKKIALIVNNFNHLNVIRLLIDKLIVGREVTLFVFGTIDGLENEALKLSQKLNDIIVYKNGERDIIKNPIRYHMFLISLYIKYSSFDFMIYFVDKYHTNQFLIEKNKCSQNILIEEGIGLYNESKCKPNFIKRIISLISKLYLVDYVNNYQEQGAKAKHHYLFCKFPNSIPALKEPKYECFSFSEVAKKNKGEQLGKTVKNCVFYVGSNTCDLTTLLQKEELKLFNWLVNLCKNECVRLIVKLHPKEKKKKYELFNVDFCDSLETSENIIHEMAPKYCFTFMSSTILNVKANSFFLCGLSKVDFPNKSNLMKQVSNYPKHIQDIKTLEQCNMIVKKSSGNIEQKILELLEYSGY